MPTQNATILLSPDNHIEPQYNIAFSWNGHLKLSVYRSFEVIYIDADQQPE